MTSTLSGPGNGKIIASIPAGRMARPPIAQVIVDVAGATYMYGATVPVDGGLLNSFIGPGPLESFVATSNSGRVSQVTWNISTHTVDGIDPKTVQEFPQWQQQISNPTRTTEHGETIKEYLDTEHPRDLPGLRPATIRTITTTTTLGPRGKEITMDMGVLLVFQNYHENVTDEEVFTMTSSSGSWPRRPDSTRSGRPNITSMITDAPTTSPSSVTSPGRPPG